MRVAVHFIRHSIFKSVKRVLIVLRQCRLLVLSTFRVLDTATLLLVPHRTTNLSQLISMALLRCTYIIIGCFSELLVLILPDAVFREFFQVLVLALLEIALACYETVDFLLFVAHVSLALLIMRETSTTPMLSTFLYKLTHWRLLPNWWIHFMTELLPPVVVH